MKGEDHPVDRGRTESARAAEVGRTAAAEKRSSVRHTRAIQRDRSRRPPAAPPAKVVTERLTELIHPATLVQVDHFCPPGLRERLLTLPVIVALGLSMI